MKTSNNPIQTSAPDEEDFELIETPPATWKTYLWYFLGPLASLPTAYLLHSLLHNFINYSAARVIQP